MASTRLRYYFLIGVMLCALLPSPAMATDDDLQLLDSSVASPEPIGSEVVADASVNESSDAPQQTTPPVSEAALPPLEVVLESSLPGVHQLQEVQASSSPVVQLHSKVIPADADVIVSGFTVDSDQRLVAIELYNARNGFVDLSRWSFEAVYTDGNTDVACQFQQDGYLPATQHVTITRSGATVDVPWPHGAVVYDGDMACDQAPGSLVSIEVFDTATQPAQIVERVDIEGVAGDHAGTWIRKAVTTSARTGTFSTDFPDKSRDTRQLLYGELYVPPPSAPLQIIEVYVTPPQCAPNDESPLCRRYIKIFNQASEAIDLSHYQLRGGSPLSRSTASNTTQLRGILDPAETVLVTQSASGGDIYLGSTDGTVWFEDVYGVRDYRSASNVAPYASAATVGHTGLSWALDSADDTWKWSRPSPDTANNIIRAPEVIPVAASTGGLTPCRSDQYRSPETNRCRLISSNGSTLTACKVGQYRSPQTNRCRSATLAGSSLKPCRDDQYRSEQTNRCRSVLGAKTSRVPCKDTQYRSEITNRCRNKVASGVPAAAFAVEPVADSSVAFMGWWLLGGASAVALGYGAWEWRREMRSAIHKVGELFAHRR
ncbi:MAG: hypothetical protein ABIR91_05880 [Candidatus Saccharimonadales bacterium]